ncbi:hypothetical protein [Haliangium sp.]|uniref:hypothetical protein n=1 Tax=Haliangium sp. TaxID=2663208 RepID=UPI003D0C4039
MASAPLQEGQTVSLEVFVASVRQVSLRGTVVKASSTRVVVAFSNSDAKRALLTAAFSERCVELAARVTCADPDEPTELTAQVLRLGEAGCVARIEAGPGGVALSLGTDVTVTFAGVPMQGCVVASSEHDRWVLFDPECDAVGELRALMRGKVSGGHESVVTG